MREEAPHSRYKEINKEKEQKGCVCKREREIEGNDEEKKRQIKRKKKKVIETRRGQEEET